MRIDAHQHFWHYSPAGYKWIGHPALMHDFLPEDLIPLLAESALTALSPCKPVQRCRKRSGYWIWQSNILLSKVLLGGWIYVIQVLQNP